MTTNVRNLRLEKLLKLEAEIRDGLKVGIRGIIASTELELIEEDHLLKSFQRLNPKLVAEDLSHVIGPMVFNYDLLIEFLTFTLNEHNKFNRELEGMFSREGE